MAKGIVKKLEFALDRLRGCDRGLDKQESYVTLK
jgi:hypothetical protein